MRTSIAALAASIVTLAVLIYFYMKSPAPKPPAPSDNTPSVPLQPTTPTTPSVPLQPPATPSVPLQPPKTTPSVPLQPVPSPYHYPIVPLQPPSKPPTPPAGPFQSDSFELRQSGQTVTLWDSTANQYYGTFVGNVGWGIAQKLQYMSDPTSQIGWYFNGTKNAPKGYGINDLKVQLMNTTSTCWMLTFNTANNQPQMLLTSSCKH